MDHGGVPDGVESIEDRPALGDEALCQVARLLPVLVGERDE